MKTIELSHKHISDFGILYTKARENRIIPQHDRNDGTVHLILHSNDIYEDQPIDVKDSISNDPLPYLSRLLREVLDLKPKHVHVHFDPPRIIREDVQIALLSSLSTALITAATLKSVTLHWFDPDLGQRDLDTLGCLLPKHQIIKNEH
jgi:hypothetical protein